MEDVNTTLAILQKHFEAKRSAGARVITLKQLDGLGGRVSGTSGKRMLSILQRFGYISFRKDQITWKWRAQQTP